MKQKMRWLLIPVVCLSLLTTACSDGEKKPLETQTQAPDGQVQKQELPLIEDITLSDVSVDAENPIDKAFSGQYDPSLPTAVVNLVAEEYLNAWQAEFENIITACEGVFDPENVALRRAQYEEKAALAQTEEIKNWSDAQGNPGTGASSAGMMAKAGTLKQAVYHLKKQYDSHAKGLYIYVYSGSGVDLSQYLEDPAPEDAGVLAEDEVIQLLKTAVIDPMQLDAVPSMMFEGEQDIDGVPCFVMSVGLDAEDKMRVTHRYGVELHGAIIYELELDENVGVIIWEDESQAVT